MKTKFNRILSSLLVAIMLFGAVSAIIPPISADAAYSSDVTSTAQYTLEQIEAIVKGTRDYNFETAEEMLRYELSEDSSVSFDRNGLSAFSIASLFIATMLSPFLENLCVISSKSACLAWL